MVNSSTACSVLSFVTDLFILISGGILSHSKPLFGFRYLAACQIFASSARKSFQYVFFYLRILSWYSLAAFFACCSNFGRIRPARHWVLARFLQCMYIWWSCIRSIVHHLFAYSEGLAFGVSAWTTS